MVNEFANELIFMVETDKGEKQEMRIPLSAGSLAGAAVLDNKIINLKDCYHDERFNRDVDLLTGLPPMC